MIYSSIGLIGLIVLFIVNFDIFKKNNNDAIEDNVKLAYKNFLYGVIGYFITDILWGIFYDAGLTTATYLTTVFYFIIMALSLLLWTRYVSEYLDRNTIVNKAFMIVGYSFVGFIIISLIFNCLTPIVFWLDEAGVYHTGELRFLILVIQVFLFFLTALYSLIVIIKERGRGVLRLSAIGFYGLLMVASVILQAFYSLLPLYSVGLMIGTCVIHTFVMEDEKEASHRELKIHLEKEQRQIEEIISTRIMAYTDPLTGAKNAHAYVEAEQDIDKRIEEKTLTEFSVIVFDLNDLKVINDTEGHNKGDEYIREAYELISDTFENSTVYRIGGDEFVTILEGEDYLNREELFNMFEEKVLDNQKEGKVVISSGKEDFDASIDKKYRLVFTRADKKMYDKKKELKENKSIF